MTQEQSEKGSAYQGTTFVHGRASGKLVASNRELSFWGGVDAQSGEVIDRHHPLSGQSLRGRILAIPGGRGSCSGSGVVLELLLNGNGPMAIILSRRDDILILGVLIAEEVFNKSIPIIVLSEDDFARVLRADEVSIYGSSVSLSRDSITSPQHVHDTRLETMASSTELSDLDKSFLDGTYGEAAALAMRIVLRVANLQKCPRLMDIAQVHVDGCIYTGPGSLAFAEKLRSLGGKTRIPTTLNSISVDLRRWRAQSIPTPSGEVAEKLAAVYVEIGARATFTCAPYLLDSAPAKGDQIAWAESNAVVYANSVLGARTMKYPDFLDICIALTGRAPYGGLHIDEHRLAQLCVRLPDLRVTEPIDDSFYPLLGYYIGALAGSRIPTVTGLESLSASNDDLKSFGAAFATVASAPMFHIVGVTPEAATLEAAVGKGRSVPTQDVDLRDVESCWANLNTAPADKPVDLISLGNPHFSISEVRKLAALCQGRTKHEKTTVIVTCGRSTHGLASQAGLVGSLEKFGVQFVTDTCWCMITDPVIPQATKVIMTNSAKYAHYGPGLTGRQFRFGGLADCVEAACWGVHSRRAWRT